MRWFRDRVLWAAIGVALLLRVIPLWVWMRDGCLRDECTYLRIAHRFVDGEGMTTSGGWLWAPGYPWLLSLHERATGYAGTVKITQILVALLCIVLIYEMTLRIFRESEEPRRAARISACFYALSPHLAFFSIRLWSEVVYGTILLGGLLLLAWARDRWSDPSIGKSLAGAALVGVILGTCVLFRGVATYMLPVLLLGVVWQRFGSQRAWLQAAVLAASAVLVVAPYSFYASDKFGSTVISDRTLGQMMWLGNNEFDPISFDYGSGQLSRRAQERRTTAERKQCANRKEAIARDQCLTEGGKEWIREHKGEFVRRIPMRVAQLVTPHSLLTRHLRWGRWKGMPQWCEELIIAAGALSSFLAMLLGAVGLAIRGRGAMGLVFSGILLYHVAAVAVLAGLSRYRVPLEPLLMIYGAGILADSRGSVQVLRECRWRAWLTGIGLIVFLPLLLWYLPAAWPSWNPW